MKLYLVAIFLGVCIAGVLAGIDVQYNEWENQSLADRAGLRFSKNDEIQEYAKKYADFRSQADNSTQDFEDKEKPKGIVCFLAIRIDAEHKGIRRVIKLDADNGDQISLSDFAVEPFETDFVFNPLQVWGTDLENALSYGKEAIRFLYLKLKPNWSEYKTVSFVHFALQGTVNGADAGKYMFFGVVFRE